MKNISGITAFTVILSVAIFTHSCDKTKTSLPVVTTTSATSITQTTASSGGNVSDNGGAEITEKGVCWNTSNNPTASNSKTSDGKGSGVFTSNITSLTPGKTYYLRAYATNSAGTAYGNEVSFKTSEPGNAPTVATLDYTLLTSTSVTLNGTVNANGLSTTITFEYGTTRSYGQSINATPATVTGSTITDVSASLTGLTASTLYYYRIKAVSANGTTYGTDMSFTTTAGGNAPVVTTSSASSITSTNAILNGSVNANNLSTTVTFEYGTTTAYGLTISASPGTVTGTTTTSVAASLTSLTANTLYHYRIKGVSTAGTSTGSDITFTTTSTGTPPTATTTPASSVTNTTATLNGTVNANSLTTTVTFEYGTTTSYGSTVDATPNVMTGNTTTSVSAAITSLTLNTTYHYRVKAVSNAGTSYGNDGTFTTTQTGTAPIVATTAATSVTLTGATLNGTVNANNLSTTVIFEFGPTTDYGFTINASPYTVSGTTVTVVSAVLSTLNSNTTYHYRIKAVSTGGTSLGTDMTFTTTLTGSTPIAETSAATAVTSNAATLNGNVNANSLNTSVSFEYGLSTSYGQSVNASPNTVTGNATTAVSVNLTTLTPNSTYHFRVKAINAAGTSLGNDLTFSTTQTGSAPTAATSAATAITSTAATFNGTVNANNLTTAVTFEYGINTSYGQSIDATPNSVTGNTTTSVAATHYALTANTTYHFRIKAVNSAGTTTGSDMTFTTTQTGSAPTAATSAATSITSTAATFNGTVNANNLTTTVTFEYGLYSTYGQSVNATPNSVTGATTTSVAATLTTLTANTLYHYRVKAVNSAGTSIGSDMTFTTASQSTIFSYNKVCTATGYVVDITNKSYEGILCATDLIDTENKLIVSKIQFKYRFGTIVGEPTRSGIFMWSGSSGTNKINTITVRAKVYNSSNIFTNYYNYYSPLVLSSSDTWSWDVAESPNWNSTFKDASGNFMSESATKSLFINGFKLQELEIVKLNGKDRQ